MQIFGFEKGVSLVKYFDTQYLVAILLGVVVNFFCYSDNSYYYVFICLGSFDVCSFILNIFRTSVLK